MKTDMNRDSRARLGICLLIPFVIVVIALGVSVGSVFISPWDTLRVVCHKLFRTSMPDDISAASAAIIWDLRLPRVLLAFLTGAAMSAGGAVTQSVLHNPLASPYTLGVSSGASVGAALVTVFGAYKLLGMEASLAATGTLFGIITVVICIILASRIDKNLSSSTIVLLGMVLSLFLSAVFTLVAGLSRDKMTLLIRWQMGSFASKGWETVWVLAPVAIVCLVVIMAFSREMDILSFGDESALTIGVNVGRLKWLLLGLTAVLTSTAVSFAGVIGFIDLIAPHVARKLFSPKHKYLCPASVLMGGGFMVISDLISRTVISGTELPVGAVTAFIGGPFFAYIFFSRRKSGGIANA